MTNSATPSTATTTAGPNALEDGGSHSNPPPAISLTFLQVPPTSVARNRPTTPTITPEATSGAPIRQRHDPNFSGFTNAFDFQAHEFIGTFAQRLRRQNALGFDQRMQLFAQSGGADANKSPRLHKTHAGRMVRGGEQTAHGFGRNRAAAGEMAHIAALENRAVNAVTFGLRKSAGKDFCVQSSIPRCAGIPA